MISFYDAATNLERICEDIDYADDITQELKDVFAEANDNLTTAVDRRISYIKYCESQIDAALNMREEWNDRAKKFQKILERIKLETIDTIKANPNLPYRGEMGKLRVQRNSAPTLCIDEANFAPSQNCYIEKISKTLNKQMIIEELKAGNEISGAWLEYGEHLRIGL